MATAHDVAAFILERMGGRVDAFKLQKLTYYAQAWTLAWDGQRLFDEPIEAWRQGPVVRALYKEHRQQYFVTKVELGEPRRLQAQEIANIDGVIDFYGRFTGSELSRMTHDEGPWQEARGDLAPIANSQAEISPASMLRFYTHRLAESVEGPVRKSYPRLPSPSEVQSEINLQLGRWQETLDRMDER